MSPNIAILRLQENACMKKENTFLILSASFLIFFLYSSFFRLFIPHYYIFRFSHLLIYSPTFRLIVSFFFVYLFRLLLLRTNFIPPPPHLLHHFNLILLHPLAVHSYDRNRHQFPMCQIQCYQQWKFGHSQMWIEELRACKGLSFDQLSWHSVSMTADMAGHRPDLPIWQLEGACDTTSASCRPRRKQLDKLRHIFL